MGNIKKMCYNYLARKFMIKIPVKIKIPFLWGKNTFKKENWSQINLIVGPNGSGKTIISKSIAQQFSNAGFSIKIFNTDLIDEDEIYYVLNQNPKIQQKIENILSNMFAKTIRFEQGIDNTIVPIATNKTQNLEYSITKNECHGLKKIISLLATLYLEESNATCLMIDEPELHLHPQFQNFFMQEIRKVTEKNSKKIFFIITHSPFFIDLKTPEELIGVVVCHSNQVPTSIDTLSENDYSLFKRFLPRFNTYHKQFFFSDNQIFVEGYTDYQVFSTLLNKLDFDVKNPGTGIIDVGGKDELGVFFKVCYLLGTNARIITDLDSLFTGKLREEICKDKRVQQWLDHQTEKQQPFLKSIFIGKTDHITFLKLLNKLDKYLLELGDKVLENQMTLPSQLADFKSRLRKLSAEHENVKQLDTYKTVLLQGIMNVGNFLEKFILKDEKKFISNVKNLLALILAASEAARVYILPTGCIEHFYTQNKVTYMPISAKDRLFHEEYDYMNSLNVVELNKKYPILISILSKASAI